MRFIHTADWQIGKVFKQFGSKEESLRQARLAAIERLGELARQHNVPHILVAGDIYDTEAPNVITLREPIERMKLFPDVSWHLLPGNHDPHRPGGVWDRVADVGLPSHIHLHLKPDCHALGSDSFLLTAPLLNKSRYDDPTEWMNAAETPAGSIRIGLAHGGVVDFASEGETPNLIDPTRPSKARLDYLALGDWHRMKRIGPAVWYSGTPEVDRAGGQERGTALLVEIPVAGAVAAVTPLEVGTYRWLTWPESLLDAESVTDLERRIRAEAELSRLVLRLQLEGTLPLATLADLRARLVDLEAAVFHLDVDETGLGVRPTQADLESIDFDGVLRRAADRLRAIADDESKSSEMRRRAEDALVELYLRCVSATAQEAA